MERSALTDERLDGLAATLDTNVRMLREEIAGLRTDMQSEFRALRGDMPEDSCYLRADLSAWQRQIAQIGWALAIASIGTVVAPIITVV
jgi:hypothetical protein